MSKRTEVLFAVRDLIGIALPGATVLGLDGDEAPAGRVPDAGRVIVRSGDPGEADVDLSPVHYWYEHGIPIEAAANALPGRTSEECVDDMLVAIGEAIEKDRSLGGLCIWLEATAPATEDIPAIDRGVVAARPPRGAALMIVAHYGTANPLT